MSDEQKIQFALTEFWRQLACEIGTGCHGKYWNALCVDATVDYGHLGGKAFIFTNRATKTLDIRNMPCQIHVTLSILHWKRE